MQVLYSQGDAHLNNFVIVGIISVCVEAANHNRFHCSTIMKQTVDSIRSLCAATAITFSAD